ARTSGWRSRRCTSDSGQKMMYAQAPAMATPTKQSARNSSTSSVLRRAGRAGVGDGVADVGQPADVDDQAFEAEAEAGVGHGAVAAEVAVPGVQLAVEAELVHARVEHGEALLALRTADDLADA